jgi:hypothetical protein
MVRKFISTYFLTWTVLYGVDQVVTFTDVSIYSHSGIYATIAAVFKQVKFCQRIDFIATHFWHRIGDEPVMFLELKRP